MSQEALFRDLDSLKKLLAHGKAVSDATAFGSDPFAAQISGNLRNLIKAAERFCACASSTASTRYGGAVQGGQSAWGGSVRSDNGGLTDFQRERIQAWNQLQPVKEGK